MSSQVAALKVLHCCARFFPDRGGSETYTQALIRGLDGLGVASVVASAGVPAESYQYRNIPVHRLGWAGDGFSRRFDELLRAIAPSLVHVHARTLEWTPEVLGMIRRRGLAAVLTYHHQSISCPRGDLMVNGRHVCEGRLDAGVCVPCKLVQHGVPRALAAAANGILAAFGGVASRGLPESRLRTAFEIRGVVRQRIESTLRFLQGVDRVVVLSEWGRRLMLSNGVPAERIVLSRLGTHHAPPRVRAEAVPDPPALRGIYVGRLHPSKGVGVLVRAMGALNGAPISVDVYGPSEGEHGFPCDVAAPNVSYRGALPDDEVVNVMAGYDFAAVPTQVPESGPFTVIEALQAGIPVIGSDVPGINELVEHGRNGLLVDPASVSEWTRVLGRLASRPADLRSLRGFARPSRTMSDVAAEMFDVYRQLVASSRGRAASVA